MKNCDTHGVLFGTDKHLSPDEGYLISAAYVKETGIYKRFLEKDRALVEGLGLTMPQYRAQMDSVQGNAPWMICEDCIKEFNLSEGDLRKAKNAALLWEHDKAVSGITPSSLSQGKTENVSDKPTILDSTPLLFALVIIHTLFFLFYAVLFANHFTLGVVFGVVMDTALVFAAFMLVRRNWKFTSIAAAIVGLPVFLLNFIAIAIGRLPFRAIYLISPILMAAGVYGLVWVGKKVLARKEKPMAPITALILSVITSILSSIVSVLSINILRFSHIALSIFVSLSLVLLIYGSIGKKPEETTASTVVSPTRSGRVLSRAEKENILENGTDEEAMAVLMDTLLGK